MRFAEADTRKEAEQMIGCDWAKMVRCEGGWMGFETIEEYETWRKQR
jgi:hypothetical protein